jgi:hypothetical protein
MDPKKFEAMEIRVDGAGGIAITTLHLDGQYRLHYSENVEATRSAHIVLFSLLSTVPGMPIFRGRWDNAASAVDIDLEGTGNRRLAFRCGLSGYIGHYTTQISTSPRK